MTELPRVEVLSADDAGDVVSVISEAFFDYPVMRFVLGSAQDYASRLKTLVTFFVRALLEAVHDLSGSRESSTGVWLTTELASNVPLYEHFGYEVIGSAPVESAFTTWTMFRRDDMTERES